MATHSAKPPIGNLSTDPCVKGMYIAHAIKAYQEKQVVVIECSIRFELVEKGYKVHQGGKLDLDFRDLQAYGIQLHRSCEPYSLFLSFL